MEQETLKFSEIDILQMAKKASLDNTIAFAAACATRLLPAYEKISSRLNRQILIHAKELLGKVWESSLDSVHHDMCPDVSYLLEFVSHEDDAEKFVESVAEDALSAIAYAARAVSGKDGRDVVWAARRAYESADRFVARRLNVTNYTPEAESFILSHKIVQVELDRQRRDMKQVLVVGENMKLAMKLRAESESTLPLQEL